MVSLSTNNFTTLVSLECLVKDLSYCKLPYHTYSIKVYIKSVTEVGVEVCGSNRGSIISSKLWTPKE